jgi:uncharacterized repeat protein (TIGR02543 family)/LPXTG-motif cell wall-anchored protein
MNWLKKSLTALLATVTLFGTGITTPIIADDGDPKGIPASETTATAAPEATATPVATAAATATPISYPVFDYAETVDGVVVTLHADEGILAKGTTATISSVTTQVADGLNGKFNEYKAFDINLYDANGNIISNDAWNGKVSVTFSGAEIETMKDNADTLSVVNVDTAGNIQETKDITNETANSVSFEAEHFSIYVIGTTALKTYNFLDVNGTTISSQQVKSNDNLEDPGAPSIDGYKFIGWNTSSDGKGDTFTAFGIQAVSDSGTVNLYATYKEVHYVFFMDNAGRIYTTKEGVSGDVITTDVTFPLGSEQGITGWYTDSALTNKVDSITLGMENVTLYPNVESGFWITYNTNGGSFIDPVFVAPNTTAAAPTEPTRAGYTFAEWVDANGNAMNPAAATETMTLYAKWNANTDTQYTIVYWIENANDTNYSYESSSTGYGTTGNEVILKGNAVSTDNHVNSAYKDYFRYENGHYDTGLTINGDGSTKVNVYFSRNTYTIMFTLSNDGCISASSGPEYSYYDINYSTAPKLSIGGSDYSSTYKFTAKFEQDISELWPTAANVTTNPASGRGYFKTTYYLNGFGSNVSKRLVLTKDLIEDSTNNTTTSYTAKWMANLFQITLHYMLQPTNGSENHSEYIDSTKYQQTLNTDTYGWNAKNIEGFTAEKNDVHYSDENIYFYYTRNSYTLTLHNYDGSENDSAHLYETDLSSYKNYVPAKPESLKNQPYSFAGWYTDESYTTKYDFTDAKMPANNLILYAKWELPSYNASYYDNMNGDGNAIDLGSISYGNAIAEDTLVMPTIPAGSRWVGWTTRTGTEGNYTYTTYNFNTAVTKDVVLYPYYISTEKFAVAYDANGGTGNVTDVKGYAQGAYADVSDNSYTAPEGKVFLNWNTSATGDGVTYYPGDKVKINETNVVLYAQWGDQPQSVTLKYDANGGTGTMDAVSFDTLTNGTTTVSNNGFTAPTNKKFNGWNTDKNGNGTAFEIGEQIGVDNLSSIDNILYAQWTDIDAKLNVADNEKIYDATSLSSVATVTGADAAGFVVYYQISDGKWTTAAPSITNVSESTTVSVKAVKEGCTDLEGSYTLTISKKPVTVTAEAASKAFGTADPAFTATVGKLVNNESADLIKYTVSRPNAGTEEAVGTYTGAVVAAGEASQGNYSVSYVPADFTITTNTTDLGLTAENGGGEYNGSAYYLNNVAATGTAAEGSTIEYKVGEGDWSTTAPSATNVADSLTGISVRVSKTGYQSVEIDKLSITVTQKPVTVTANKASKAFGTADPAFTATVGKLVNNESADLIKYTVSRPNAGTEEAVGTYTGAVVAAGEASQGNYSVSYVPADFTITTNTTDLGLTAENGGGEYNGSAYYLNNVAATGTAAEGSTIEYKVGEGDWSTTAPSATNVADSLTGISVRVSKTGYQSVEIDKLSITVTQKPVTVTANKASKAFGTADPAFTATVGKLVNNESADLIKYTVSRPNAGTEEAVGTYTGAVVAAGEASQGNYSVSYVPADFTITTNTTDLGLTAENGGGEYNGSAYYLNNVAATGTAAEGSTIEYKVGEGDWSTTAPSATNVADSLTGISVRVSKTGYQSVEIDKLSITVTQKPVTVTANKASKAFGTADPAFTATVGKLVNNESADLIKYTVSRPNAGTEEAVGTYTGAVVAAGEASQGNYSVSYVPADFTITTNTTDLGLTAENGGGEYNGSAYYLNNVAATGTAAEGSTIEYKVGEGDWSTTAPSATNVADSLTGISVRVSKTGYQSVEIDKLSITVTQKPVTVTANKASKAFGTADPAFTATVGKLVNNESADLIKYTVSRPNAGTEEAVGTYTGAVVAAGEASQGNYSVSYVPADFTITTNTTDLGLTAENGGGEYNGSAYYLNNVAATGTAAEGSTIEYKVGEGDWSTTAPSATNVADSLTGISVRVSKTGYQSVEIDKLSITVTQKPVTVTANKASKAFGTADPAFTATVGKLVNNESADLIKYTVSRPNAGTEEAVGTYTGAVVAAGEASQGNYSVSYVPADFTITTNTTDLGLTAENGGGEYNGSAYYLNNVAATGTAAEGSTIEYKVGEGDWSTTAPSATNVADSLTGISVRVSKTGYQSVEIDKLSITVTQKPVTVTANKASKAFGTADPAFTATVGKLVNNESADLIKYTVSRPNAGTEEAVGTYTGAVVAAGEASQGNYSVSYVPADFTIIASNENAVFATGYTGTYDGSAHSITAKAAQNGSTMYYSTDNQTWSETLPEYTDAAETRTVYVKAVNPNYEDALGQAEVTINKRNVTLTSGTSSKRYDGTALTNENVTVSGDGFVTGEGAVYTVTGTQIEVGTSENTFTYAMNAETKADNYNVTVVNGTLTVTERPVTPITPDEPDQPVTPATPETPARPTTPTTTDRPHTPNTGDQTNAGMAAGAFGFSMLAAALAIFFKKKYSE